MKRKSLLSNLTIGADIEVFLQDKDTKEIVSAEGIIKGSKEAPFFFKKRNPFFATSLDNVMAEFCIPPAKTAKEFNSNIQEALGYIQTSIPANLTTLAIPSAIINEKYLQTMNAQLFGCEPDYNAWRFGDMNDRPDVLSGLRSCGGHVHVGYIMPEMNKSMALVRAMDIFLGLPSVLQEPENERKRLYGKAGAFRFKDYGAEYRTISNYYINSGSLIEWVFNNTVQAMEFVESGYSLSFEEGDAIQTAINTNNHTLAKTMCDYFNVKLAA